MDGNYDVQYLFQNNFILGQPRVAIFDEIIKIVTIFKYSKKIKIKIMYQNAIHIVIS